MNHGAPRAIGELRGRVGSRRALPGSPFPPHRRLPPRDPLPSLRSSRSRLLRKKLFRARAVQEGWLLKSSGGKEHRKTFGNAMSKWDKRWFVLRGGSTMLYYYKVSS